MSKLMEQMLPMNQEMQPSPDMQEQPEGMPEQSDMNTAQAQYPFPMMLCHVNKDEQASLNLLQGGEYIDPILEIPAYPGLVEKFMDDDLRNKFVGILQQLKDMPQKAVGKELENFKGKMGHMRNVDKKLDEIEGKSDELPTDPLIEELKDAGTGGDDSIVYMPTGVCDMMDLALGSPDENPKTGLPEYKRGKGFLGKFGGTLGGLAGYLISAGTGVGLLGAAALSGAGGMAGSLAGGNRGGDVFKDALISGVTGGVGQWSTAPVHGFTSTGRAVLMGATQGAGQLIAGRPVAEALGHAGIMGAGVGMFGPAGIEAAYGPGGTLAAGHTTAPTATAYSQPFNSLGAYIAPGATKNMADYEALQTMAAANKAAIAAGLPAPYAAGAAPAAATSGLGSHVGTAGMLAGGMLSGGGYPQQQPQLPQQPSLLNDLFGGSSNRNKDEFSLGKLLPVAASAGLLYQGHKDQMKHEKKEQEHYNRQMREIYNNAKAPSYIERKYVKNPEPEPQDAFARGIAYHPYVREDTLNHSRYATGGSVDIGEHQLNGKAHQMGTGAQFEFLQGPGKGRDDSINYDFLAPGDYIGNAASVSAVGDGSSRAGASAIKAYLERLKPHSRSFENGGSSNQKPIPAALSDGEVKIPEWQVTALGGGNNGKGAKILDRTFGMVLKEKSGHGSKLPPKAKPFEFYINKSIRG